MRKTLRVTAPHVPTELHSLLASAGVPVITIRFAWGKAGDPVCIHSVIVFQDGYDPTQPVNKAAIDVVIQNHLSGESVAGKLASLPVPFDAEDSLRGMEVL